MEKKKILFYVSGIGLGGVEKVILEVLKGIDKEKYDIKLGLNNENENFFENEIPKEINYQYMVNRKIIEKTLMYKKRKNILNKLFYSYMLWYEKYIAKKNFLKFAEDRDILIDFKSGDYLRLINLFKDKKKMVWLHGELSDLVKYKKNKKNFEKNLRKCNRIILISQIMKELFVKKVPELAKRTELIYNPFDFESIRKKSTDLSEEDNKSIEMLNSNYFLMVSRIDFQSKDFETLLKAFKIFSKDNREYNLFLLGDGSKKDMKILELKIREYNLEKRVILLGVRKNPYPWIKNAEILIQSSRYEGLPTVLIEGLILDKKIIATDCPTGPREILENGKIGKLIKIGDYISMAQNMKKVLEEENKKDYKESIERFEKDRILKKIESLIDNLL